MKTLKIARDLMLPLDVVTQKLGWIGTTGSGKTYGASKLAELFWDAGAQFVALDPVGVWYGLRLAKDGKRPSDITIPIFGGLHGDVPLESAAGALLADLVVDRTLSVIIDVSQFESDAQKARFAADFADRFFFRKKARPSAVHLFLEEVQEFCPENQQRGEERMLHAFVRMQKIGRNFGIGSSYITQRPQEVAKKALNLAQTLFVFRTTGTHERAAIERWIKDKAIKDQDIADELPRLATGAPHVWSPEWLGLARVVSIGEKRTFNASATPEVGAGAVTRHLAPIDLAKIRDEMAATIERAKADDPKELRKEIIELGRRLTAAQKASSAALYSKPPEIQIVEKPILKDVQITRLETLVRRLTQVEQVSAKIADAAAELATAIMTATKPRPTPDPVLPVSRASRTVSALRIPAASHVMTRRVVPTTNGYLPPGEKAILIAAVQYPGGITREHASILTGYRRSSRDAYVQRLIGKSYVEIASGVIVATKTGASALGSDYEQLPVGKDLQRYWLDRLPPGEKAILATLLPAFPRIMSRDSLDATIGYKTSSRNAYLQRLKARQLVVVTRDGIAAHPVLFDSGMRQEAR